MTVRPVRPIRTNDDLTDALERIDQLWGKEPNTPEGDELDVLLNLVESYEDKSFPIGQGGPVEVLKAHMTNTGRTQADLGELFGSRPRASEVLNKKRVLTVDMIHKLNSGWNIPADCLIKPYHLAEAE